MYVVGRDILHLQLVKYGSTKWKLKRDWTQMHMPLFQFVLFVTNNLQECLIFLPLYNYAIFCTGLPYNPNEVK